MMALLDIKGLSKYFGGLAALRDIDLEIHESQIIGIIGPNGAGKTTLFNVISGAYRPDKGTIFFKGENINGQSMDKLCRKGLVRTWQGSLVLKDMSVLENVLVGFYSRSGARWSSIFHLPSTRLQEERNKREAIQILEFFKLSAFKHERAGRLPYGHQKALGVAIALAASPELILLDEPTAGMSPEEISFMMDHIKRTRDRGVTIVIIEHNMRTVMNICERVVVLNFGTKIAEGTPDEVMIHRDVVQAYLGVEMDE
jgi:branched-chain amino acid transport system ATP-binding protein